LKIALKLDATDVQDAAVLANQATLKYRSGIDRYSSVLSACGSTFRRNFVGKLGEFAAERLFFKTSNRVVSIFRDERYDYLCDLGLERGKEGFRVEVKTCSEPFWKKDGRSIRPDLLPAVRCKADVVLWCVSHHASAYRFDDVSPAITSIDIMGFSSVEDLCDMSLTLTGVDYGAKMENYQLPEPKIRGMETLAEFIAFFKYPRRYFYFSRDELKFRRRPAGGRHLSHHQSGCSMPRF
jgi:hypothetical protein